MKILLLLAAITSGSAFAFDPGSYECDADAFTSTVVKISTQFLSGPLPIHYVDLTVVKRGVRHVYMGVATVGISGAETSLFLAGYPGPVITFVNGKASDNCKKI